MKYISLIDELGIDINTIATLDATKIIRLQKQLKANAVLNNKSNLGELASLIEQLKDENIRKHHVFVENHKWLKQIISGDYTNISQSSVAINLENVAGNEELKYFLSPYFKEHIKPFLSETLNKGKYNLLYDFIESNIVVTEDFAEGSFLFTEEIEQIIISFFSSKLNYAKVYIESGKLNDKHFPVAYITNRNFIKCLSQYPSSFDDEVNELNSEVIDTYNSKRKNTDNDIFIFAAKAMVAFGELEVSNYMLKDVLDSNAAIARPHAFRSGSKSKSGSGVGIWSGIIFLILIIRIATKVFKNDNSSYDSNYRFENIKINSSDYNEQNILEAIKIIQERQEAQKNGTFIEEDEIEVEETVIEATKRDPDNNKITLPDISTKKKAKDHTRFIYTLKSNTKRKDENLGSVNSVELNAFTNPYPKTFNLIRSLKTKLMRSFSSYRLVKNNSKKDLIVFRLTDGIDQSIFIPKDESVYLNLIENDSILFYTGNNFVVDRLSHFTDNKDLSKLYIIDNIVDNSQEINVLPYKISTYKGRKLNSKKEETGTTKKDVIKTKNITLRGISIDKVYLNWYRKKYD
ncbi:hypothetical protein [Olleya sp. R77988]|uniref:hypothetical protein n=1 Tax=Olleya sp. R77988 TaxID=3093875 RepID=UPI0037CB1C54